MMVRVSNNITGWDQTINYPTNFYIPNIFV
jgi:hypothetical protein